MCGQQKQEEEESTSQRVFFSFLRTTPLSLNYRAFPLHDNELRCIIKFILKFYINAVLK